VSRRKYPRFVVDVGHLWSDVEIMDVDGDKSFIIGYAGRGAKTVARALARDLNAVLDKHEEARDGK